MRRVAARSLTRYAALLHLLGRTSRTMRRSRTESDAFGENAALGLQLRSAAYLTMKYLDSLYILIRRLHRHSAMSCSLQCKLEGSGRHYVAYATV